MAKIGKRVAKSTRALIEELHPSVKRAWHRSVSDLAQNINFAALRKAIEDKDLEAAEEALNLDGSFEALEKSLMRAFEAGGKMTAQIISEEVAKNRG